MKRSQIREQIFKLLFRVEFNKAEDMPEQIELFMEAPTLDTDENDYKEVALSEEEEKYIRNKFDDIVNHISEIDNIIGETAKGWSSERIGKVELTILRLAIYEIKFDDDIPVSVAIDQAVELSKRFGRDESYSFINGILAKLAN
ncbi:MAG: transcription antitermination factor NusB [Lachnospiraceae bacterium]|nr:transcription antitermination factor NusB [Lachnospiraceae bacterium]